MVFLVSILEPHWQVKVFDAFQHIQTNNVERNIFMATEHEPKDKLQHHHYLANASHHSPVT